MKNIILYTTHCPKCKILKQKLDESQLQYVICDDTKTMIEMGLMTAPVLSIDNELLNFMEAMKWIENNKENAND